jgi:uncharacterized repeat protein (TIGR01451 family)
MPHLAKRILSPVFSIILLIVLVFTPLATRASGNLLTEIQLSIQKSHSYHFIADIEQTLIPQAVPAMIGQPSVRVDLRAEGDVHQPDYAQMQITYEGNTTMPPMNIVQNGDKSYIQVGGERQETENPLGTIMPNGDCLSYLTGAEHVTLVDDSASPLYASRYTFDISGPQLARVVRDQIQAQMQASGELPLGVELSPSPLLESITGNGEIWLDANNLPLRQELDLHLLQIAPGYDAQIHMLVDFSAFGQENELFPINGDQSSGIGELQSLFLNSQSPIISPSSIILFLTCFTFSVIIYLSRRYPHKVYAVISIAVILSMLLGPLLQMTQIVRFQERTALASEPNPENSEQFPADSGQLALAAEQLPLTTYDSPLSTLNSPLSTPNSFCGSGDSSIDTDGDTIDDASEYCLGTNPYAVDSDNDLITDTLEIDGFDLGGQHWVGDPLEADSNGDGLSDFSEWPAPAGEAPAWDPDGDDVPNLWDDDNDGDGVPDYLDFSPYSSSSYNEAFSLNTQAGDFDGYQYIELQLQPENADHLRYSTAVLDWPYDEEGQLQDLDNSKDDIRLIPMLKVRVNQVPETNLARSYGVSVFAKDGVDYLYAPVSPVSDGGKIVAFYTKVAYGPGNLEDIEWDNARLVWMVQMNNDQEIDGNIITRTDPIHVYAGEPFRVTGLQVVKSRDYQHAVLGTPGTPGDDRNLFNLLLGMSATFLHNQTPDLQTIENRFNNPNTDIVETWGLASTLVTVDLRTFAHTDEGLSDLISRGPRFLNDNGYPTDSNPSLLIAIQEEVGAYSLDDAGLFEWSGQLTVNMDEVHLSTQRTLKLNTYSHQSGQWQPLELEGVLETVLDRYPDLSAVLADLQLQYPDLVESDLTGVLIILYSLWNLGQTTVVAMDGQPMAPDDLSDQMVFDQLFQTLDSLPAYLIEAGDLAQPGGGLKFTESQYANWAYQRDKDWEERMMGFVGAENTLFDLGKGLVSLFNFSNKDLARKIANYVAKSVRAAINIMTALQCIQWASKGKYIGLTGWTGSSRAFGMGKWMKLSERKIGAIGAIVMVGLIWLQFGLTTDFSNPLAVKQAVAYAVVATVFTIALFIISLNPIGAIIVTIFYLVDMILYFATGGDFSLVETIIKGITNFFYKVNLLTYLDDADFGEMDSDLVYPDLGMSVGGAIQVTNNFIGYIKKEDGDNGDLEDSWVYGKFSGNASQVQIVPKNSDETCTRSGGTLVCENDTKIEYRFIQPGINIWLQLKASIHAKTYYEECTLGGLDCWRSSTRTDLPEDLDKGDRWDPIEFYVDVLPDTLDGLLTWNVLTNPDTDGDGLPDSQELELGTDPTLWDTDGDELSDRYEFDSQETLGCDPLDPDSDGDSLSDKLEDRLGTRIDQPDSDNDGLSDAEEVFHRQNSGTWSGDGWVVNLPGLFGTAHTFSDPLTSNRDLDGLDDFSERTYHTSPNAFNDAPRLSLQLEPQAISPSGEIAAFVQPGDPLTLTLNLDNVSPIAIAATLELCLPDFLTNLQGGSLSGNRSPAIQSPASCTTGLAWEFTGSNTLQIWDRVSTTLKANITPGTASTSAEILATLPYELNGLAEVITARARITVDSDLPQVEFTAPANGEIIGGGIDNYVIGGAAHDPTSWVTRVDLALPAGAGTVTATGVSPWAYSWELPPDGIYSLNATAYDYLAHASPADSVQVTVDNTPPDVSLDLADGTVVTGESGNAGVISIQLNGTASDNLSGLLRVQISTDSRPWREVWSVGQDSILSASWSSDWLLPDEESAQGQHIVAVRAFDQAGNLSAALERTLIVDVVPPTSELTNRTFTGDSPPHLQVGESADFHGVANDAGNTPKPPRPAELVGTLDSINDATIWLGLDSIVENDAGVSVVWLGDFNGDRLADLVVGLPGINGGAGRVTIIYGRAGGWQVPDVANLISESRTSFVGVPSAGLGDLIAPAGDVDGDGLDDLLIGDPVSSRAFLVFGRLGPLGRDLLLDGPQTALVSVIDLPGLSNLEGLAAAGDVNGDGFGDLLIGAGDTTYLLLGQPAPWWETIDLPAQAAAQISGLPLAKFGATGLGDLDGNQYDEFAIAAGNTVYLFAGQGGFISFAADELTLADALDSFASADTLPQVVPLGDVDGDTLADFIYSDGDTPQIIFGAADQLWGGQPLTGFTPAPSGFLAAPGDVDSDGLADILVDNAAGDAYLILGSDLSNVQATLTEVAEAASVPYAAGGDLNSDGSSDLLLIPAETSAAGMGMYAPVFGSIPYIDPTQLPITGQLPIRISNFEFPNYYAPMAATLTVDDDGCPGCYTSIQAAIDAAAAGDTINIQPGVYAPFTVDGIDDLIISGVHPDAVFVDGSGGAYGVRIANADGVGVQNLTIRNATNAIELINAGTGGYDDPALATKLQSLLVYDFSGHALSMDHLSTASLSQSTLAGGDDHIVISGAPDPAFVADWTNLTPAGTPAINDGGGIAGYAGDVYAAIGGGSTQISRFDPGSNTWSGYANTPLGMLANSAMTVDDNGDIFALRADEFGGFNGSVSDVAYVNDNKIYAAGNFLDENLNLINFIVEWDGSRWHILGANDPEAPQGEVNALTVSGDGRLYAGGAFGLKRWNGSQWEHLGSLTNGNVNALAVDGSDVYVGGSMVGVIAPNGTTLTVNSIARWNNGWFRAGVLNYGGTLYNGVFKDGISPVVYALAVDSSYLYVGGMFDGGYANGDVLVPRLYSGGLLMLNKATNGWLRAGSENCAGVYEWAEVGVSAPSVVNSLTLHNGWLVVGGNFDRVANTCSATMNANHLTYFHPILKWWPQTFLSTNGAVYALASSGDELYVSGAFSSVGVGNSISASRLAHLDMVTNTWVSDLAALNNAASTLVMGGGALYLGGNFTTLDGNIRANHFARYDGSHWTGQRLYQYNGATWQIRNDLNFYTAAFNAGSALAADDAGNLYALPGGNTLNFYRYDAAGSGWIEQADLPAAVDTGGALAWADGTFYAARGNNSTDFYCYNVATNAWTQLAAAPYVFGAGASLAWDGRDWVYALAGGNGKQFMRYHIPTNQWQTLGDGQSITASDKDTPSAVNAGGGLLYLEDKLFGVPGGGTAQLWQYGPVGLYPEKLALDQVAFVVPDTAASGSWYNQDLQLQPDDFRINGVNNTWVGGGSTVWSPDPLAAPPLNGSTQITQAQADFVDAARNVYRLRAVSSLNGGYHSYRPDAWVAADGTEEFTSIQAAILSGANRVQVRPGIYQESFYLLNGVSVFGSGAAATIIEPDGSSAPALVSAEGVVGSGLYRVTLNADGQGWDGLRVVDGAQSFTLERSILRGAVTALWVDGADTDLEVVNNTIVDNTDGMAATACAPVDVRNTIFAYHSGTGLAYEGCAATRLHSYNLFWGNGTDLAPAAPGAGELFLDPLFEDRWAFDYRTLADSPVIDAGNPSDPYPPGAGEAVDIGYLEQGRAAFYADDDYCETCSNDGLTWQVDAFDLIQDALNAAGDYVQTLERANVSTLNVSVGVGPGSYYETLTVPSYVRLIGSGAEDSLIDSAGLGTPVSFDGVVQSEISGFSITGSNSSAVELLGASNEITITRNIIRDNPTGISFSGRATGLVSFNTLVGNANGITSTGLGSWATVENNILAENATGLFTTADGQLFGDYNLLDNGNNYDGPAAGLNDLAGTDPLFEDAVGGNFRLDPVSPAIDAASFSAPVPAGGGARADLGYREVLAAPISIFLGKEDVSTATGNSGIGQVEVGFSYVPDPSQPVSATLPTVWTPVTLDSPGTTVTYWQSAYTPASEGLYRFYSRGTDAVDNAEEDAADWYDGAFITDSTDPVVTWLSPFGTLSAPLELRAQVSDYAAGQISVDEVYFVVDGGRVEAEWSAEPWDEESGAARILRAWIDLADGAHNAKAVAVDLSGNQAESTLVNLTITAQDPEDTTPPILNIDQPPVDGWVRRAVTFSGTVSDSESGLASVEVSLDGGYTWLPATVNGTDWELTWQAPEGQEFVSYPARVRASDRAGNTTEQPRPITIDNLAPTGLEPVTFSTPQGTHFDTPSPLTINWHTPWDGSGTAVVLLTVDQISATVPTSVVGGNSATEDLSATGDWYVHIATRDAAGNEFTRHFGPWHVGSFADPNLACALREQSVILDGYLDLTNEEWRADEFLDNDERAHLQNELIPTQDLYVSWDGTHFYLGWQGAWWLVDGGLWAYLNTGPDGIAQTIDGSTFLPFFADYALEIGAPSEGSLWSSSGGTWSPVGGLLEFAQDETGGTEVRLPWNIDQIASLDLLVFAVEDGGQPWSVFPTSNLLDGPWTKSYHWDDLCSVVDINDGQPRADSVLMKLSSPQSTNIPWGPGDNLEFVVDLTNREDHTVVGLTLAFGSTGGLSYQSVSGATCADCTPGDSWVLNVPALASGVTHAIKLTGQLDADLSALSKVTTTSTLGYLADTYAQATISHRVDGLPPTVKINLPPGSAIAPGAQTISGIASDGRGIGLAGVQFRPESGSWQAANGLLLWIANVNIPDQSTWTLEARATDKHGLASDVQVVELIVDSTAPTLTMELPASLGVDFAEIPGNAYDPYPVNSRVAQVEVQIDDQNAAWKAALVFDPVATGQQTWLFTWDLPVEDGVTHTLRARATDSVGNSTVGNWQTTSVDNVSPKLTSEQELTQVNLGDYLRGAVEGQGETVLSGTAHDGSGIGSIVVLLYSPEGIVYRQKAQINGEDWQYTPVFDPPAPGQYQLRVEVSDLFGNRTISGLYNLTVNDSPISGLVATNDSPTLWGQTTTFTATLTEGTSVDYTWDFGDGDSPLHLHLDQATTGNVISHTYTLTGIYTATVTATNSQGTFTATTSVHIVTPDLELIKAVSDDVAIAGSSIIYTLTVSNTGTHLATDVVLSDTLPGGVSLLSVWPNQGSCQSNQDNPKLVTCNLGDIGVRGQVQVILVVDILPSRRGLITNYSEVTLQEPDLNSLNNQASASTNVLERLVVYTNNFDGMAGIEWSQISIDTSPNGETFLGQFGNESVQLFLTNLPAHTFVQLSFDLYIIGSWDGNTVFATLSTELPEGSVFTPDTTIGPDIWQLSHSGKTMLLQSTFCNWPHQRQAYPGSYPDGDYACHTGAKLVNPLGYTFGPDDMDSIYQMMFIFPHTDRHLLLDFSALGLQGYLDETWGLDNVQITLSNGYLYYLPIMFR